MRVVQALALLGEPAGPNEIAEVTGLAATVVFRILQSGLPSEGERILWDGMADDPCHPAGYFIRLPPGKYRLGPGAAQVGMEAMAQTPGPEISRPVLDALARQQDGMALLWKVSPYGTPRRTVADFA
jgi:DNA-binding IclR family transcriptional regulator